MAQTGLSASDYVQYVKLQLGAPIVVVEVEPMIPDIVDMCFNELKHYISDVEFMTVSYSNVIDLKDKKVANIVYVMRDANVNGLTGLQDMMYVYSRSSIGATGSTSSSILNNYIAGLMVQQNKNALATDLDFTYDKREEKLYIYTQRNYPRSITLVYTRQYETVEEIIEPYWQNMLKRLCVAQTKEILGRVRGKYNLNSATYNLDADKLLQEAETELTEIRNYLNANNDLLLPID